MSFASLTKKRHESSLAKATGRRDRISTKLRVGNVHDPLEKQADAIADQIMAPTESGLERGEFEALRIGSSAGASLPSGHGASLHRKCAACEDEQEIHRTRSGEGGGPARERAAAQQGGATSIDFAAKLAQAGGGRGLDRSSREFLENRINTSLGGVRVHADRTAGELSQTIGARAFTHGQDIFFAPGELRTNTRSGMSLLAHEVAHTLQHNFTTHGGTIRRSAPKTEHSITGTPIGDLPPIPAGERGNVAAIDFSQLGLTCGGVENNTREAWEDEIAQLQLRQSGTQDPDEIKAIDQEIAKIEREIAGREYDTDDVRTTHRDARVARSRMARDPDSYPRLDVTGVVLHQTAGNQSKTTRYFAKNVNAHFVVTGDGSISQQHSLDTYLNASGDNASDGVARHTRRNASTIAVEFTGNFPNTKGEWPSNGVTKTRPTGAQFEAGRCLMAYLRSTVPSLRYVYGHIQSSTKTNDPGPDIWYEVGQWAIDKLGLTGGNDTNDYAGDDTAVGTGGQVPDAWKSRRPGRAEGGVECDPQAPNCGPNQYCSANSDLQFICVSEEDYLDKIASRDTLLIEVAARLSVFEEQAAAQPGRPRSSDLLEFEQQLQYLQGRIVKLESLIFATHTSPDPASDAEKQGFLDRVLGYRRRLTSVADRLGVVLSI
jgi:hypothetical protein